MNPFSQVLSRQFQSSYGFPSSGEAGAAVLLLQILRDGYTTGYSANDNAARYVLDSLAQYAPNALIDYLKISLNRLAQNW